MFQTLADIIGFPVDQIRYITLLFLSYPLAGVFRYVLHPSHTSLITRHIFSLSFGLLFGFLCFGMQMFVLFTIVGVSYALLQLLPPTVVQRYTMVWAMGSMSASHIYRMATDYGGWTLDFTGPLMVIVQKVTLVAYALHDGKGRDVSALNQDQREQKIQVCPSLLEYFTYIFNFHSFLAGPCFTIKEFQSFMDGSNLKTEKGLGEPSAAFPIVSKLLYSVLSMGAYVFLGMYFTRDMPLNPQYSIPARLSIVLVYGFVFRLKYYFAWYLSDSINNLCGLGFSGYDQAGQPQWDLVSNVKMLGVELPPNPRSIAVNWNITSGHWLRRYMDTSQACYDRVARLPISPTLATFALSALWHGFYPGYYFCFIYVGIATEVARNLRRLLRPYFQTSPSLKLFYDITTTTVTLFSFDFGVPPFDNLWVPQTLKFWGYFYFIPQACTVLLLFLVPSGKSSWSGRKSSKADSASNNRWKVD